jgi:hypothetical protein
MRVILNVFLVCSSPDLIDKGQKPIFDTRLKFTLTIFSGGYEMQDESKFNKWLSTKRKAGEAEDWIFSLTPVGVAFVFYIMFILSTDIEQKGLFVAFGAAAGLVGLESYWIVRGWRQHHISTVIMGVMGIAITLGLLNLYMSFI